MRSSVSLLVFSASLLALAALPAAFAQDASPTASLLHQLSQTHRLGDIALSPDGKTVALEREGKLVIKPLSGGSEHEVALCDGARVSSLGWSPKGQQLAVLANCGDAPQVFLATASGAAKTLTTLHGFAKSLTWTPDGSKLGVLYVEGATRPSGALAAMKPPAGEIGVEGVEVQRIATIDATSGALQQVTPTGLHVYEYSFSPDSQRIAFVAAPPPGEDTWWTAKLFTGSATGAGEPKVVLDPNTVVGPLHGLQIAVPTWSPDGKQIALVGGLMSDQGSTGGDLYLLPSDGSGAPVNLTPNSTTSMVWMDWLPSGKLIATETVGGSQRIDELAIAGAKLTDKPIQTLPYGIGDGRMAGSFALSGDGKIAAWTASSYAVAPEAYAGPLGVGPLPAITQVNSALKPSWGKAESIDWENEGFHVQGWLLYPANYDPAKKYGLIVMVHGGPSSAVTPRWPRAGFGAAPLAASGYFVLEANPRGSFGQGERFTQANRKDFGYGDLRDILAGVDAIEKRIPAVDDNRLGVTGWSYGGFMTMFSVTQTHRFKAAVAGAGIANWLSYYGENSIDTWMIPFFGDSVYNDPGVYAKSSAINSIKNVTTPTLVVVGDRDGECPAPQSYEFWHALREMKVPTTLVVYPNEGHGFADPAHSRDVLERQIAWFGKYLK